MDDHYEPLVANDNKSTTYKKYGAALGVAGISVAAALLLAGGSTKAAHTEFPTDLIEMPEDMIEANATEFIAGVQENCMYSFERLWSEQSWSINGGDLSSYMGATGKFEDPTFPADTSSLYWNEQAQGQNASQVSTYKQYQQQYGIVWKRPNELPGHTSPSLWGSNGVSPKASKQGALGDCWFLSSASAVAGVPSRVQDIFANTAYPTDGAFEVYFHVRGLKVSVVVDDRIPVLNLGQGYSTQYPPVNSKPSPAGAWWLVILEKAMSKLNVNYTQISGGTPGEAFRVLTGMPVSTHSSQQMTDAQLWTIVREGTEASNPMAAACQSGNHNLVAGHAYGILKGLCLTTNGQCVHKLIQMRNPWGLSKYTGPWSASSSLWTEEWKQQASLADADEGEFWVPLSEWRQDFVQAFNTHYRNNWNVSTLEGNPATFTKSSQVSEWMSFDNPQQQDMVIDCIQWDKRLFPQGCKNRYAPQGYGFLMYDSNLNQMNTVPQMGSCNGGAIEIKNMAAGKHIIRVFNFEGSDQGHKQIFQMKTFAADAAAPIVQIKNPYGGQ